MELIYKSVDLNESNNDLISFLEKNMTHVFNEQTYKWEYFFKAELTVFTSLLYENQIVGTQSFLPFPLLINESKINTGKSENSFILDAFRRDLNFYNLYNYSIAECHKKKIHIIWGLTQLANLWKKILHFDVYNKIIYSYLLKISVPDFKEVKSGNFIHTLAKYFRSLFSVLYLSFKVNFYRIKFKFQSLSQTYKVLEKIDSDISFKNFYDNIIREHPDFVCIEMSEAFLNWRVYTNPNLSYKSFFFYKNEKLAGYYIFSLKNRMAQLVDFIALEDKTYHYMVFHMIDELKSFKVYSMEYLGNISNPVNTKVFNLMGKILGGKLVLNKGLAFVLKNTIDKIELPEIKHWYINGLWTEGYKR